MQSKQYIQRIHSIVMNQITQIIVGMRSPDLWNVFSEVQKNRANIDPDFVNLVESEVMRRTDQNRMWTQ